MSGGRDALRDESMLTDEDRQALTVAYHDAYCMPSCGDDVSTYRPVPKLLAEEFERILQHHLDAAVARAEGAYWDGFEAALTAVEEGQRLYGTTRKAVDALRVAARIGREVKLTALDGPAAPEGGSDDA